MTDRHATIQPEKGQNATAIHLVNKESLADFIKGLNAQQRNALAAQKFEGAGYEHAVLPDGDDWLVVAGVANPEKLSSWCLGKLGEVLPAGTYRLASGEPGKAMYGWASGQYRFDRYRSEKKDEGPRVLLSTAVKAIEAMRAEVAAVNLVRDMVNTPAEDMGPAEIEAQAEALAKAHKAELRVTRGDALEREFPMVHSVGRAAARSHAPRMIELEWAIPNTRASPWWARESASIRAGWTSSRPRPWR